MTKKISEKRLDFWEKMLSDPGVCIDFGPGGASDMSAIYAALEERKKERAERAAKEKAGRD